MKYFNKRNEKVATRDEASYNPKTKTYIMVYEDGSNTTVSESTLKRWWKKLDSPETVEPLIDLDNPVTEEEAQAAGMLSGDEAVEAAVVDPDDVAGDGTPLAEVGKEIFEQAKKKAEKAKAERAKKEKAVKTKKEKETIQELIAKVEKAIADSGFTFKRYDASPRLLPLFLGNTDTKAVCTLYVAQEKCVLCLKEKDIPEGYVADRMRNCPLAAAFDFDYTEPEKLQTMLTRVKEEK